LEKTTEWAGQYVTVSGQKWLSKTWTMATEFDELLEFLESEERIACQGSRVTPKSCKIKPAGWAYLEELKSRNPDSLQGFVAMSFDEDLYQVYDHAIQPAIVEAGYKPLRANQEEHVGNIDDFIVAQIRQSRFVVADFTGQRQSVYFEAGLATGFNIPAIYTCHEGDHENLHFDIRQFNFIAWSDYGELKGRLLNRIMALLGKGSYRET
jgi:hypothetical protein